MTGVIATLLLLGYALACAVVGAAGVLGPAGWIDAILGVQLPTINGDWPPVVFSQYRFARAMELGVGLFCVFYRRDILDGGRAHLLFVAICASGILARSLSWWADGQPPPVFVGFIAYEVVTLMFVAAYARRDLG